VRGVRVGDSAIGGLGVFTLEDVRGGKVDYLTSGG
jgi:hypothetical protein